MRLGARMEAREGVGMRRGEVVRGVGRRVVI
jgi:hypothetical protein